MHAFSLIFDRHILKIWLLDIEWLSRDSDNDNKTSENTLKNKFIVIYLEQNLFKRYFNSSIFISVVMNISWADWPFLAMAL